MAAKKKTGGLIIRVAPDSLAEELGLVAGDRLLAVNDTPLNDLIDLSFAMADEEIDLLVEHADGEREILAFAKDYDEELGAEFETAVFDGIRACGNRCYFCFVDQVPPAMRSSLYIKDDDYRLSFLYGNFVTLTNIGEKDLRRIAAYHLSPLFVSVHTVNRELRQKLLGTPRAGELLSQLDRLAADGIGYHAQVVLCPELNDGDELRATIEELYRRRPAALSLAIVPVGLTRYREGCYPLRLFTAAEACNVIEMVEGYQRKFRRECGENFVYLGDEFYLLAGAEIPSAAMYDDFPQLDNGVGLVRSFIDDWRAARERIAAAGYEKPLKINIAAGTAVAPIFAALTAELNIPNLTVRVVPVANEFFGVSVNVSGLLTGRDLKAALASVPPGDGVIVPAAAVRSGDDVFLDDMTVAELQRSLGVPVITALSGAELWELLARWRGDGAATSGGRQAYMWQSNAAYTPHDNSRRQGEK